jgi:hypothetical protein
MENSPGNTVATSMILSSIISCVVASGATFLMSRDAAETADEARTRCIESEVTVGGLSSRLVDAERQFSATLAAMQAAANGYAETGQILQGMRAELDEMQTQIRLLKLMAR